MLEKPPLQDDQIIACLRDSYLIPVTSLEFLPLGNDATAWVYRVEAAGGQVYFLKVKKGTVYIPSVAIPRYLKDQGIEQVVAPLPTRAQELWTALEGFSLILYPFIAGITGMAIGLSDSQWVEFGAVLKQIHSAQLSPELVRQLQRETFVPRWGSMVRTLQARVDAGGFGSDYEAELASFWNARRVEIARIVERTEQLGRALQSTPFEFVLCHSDIHTANILLDEFNRMFIVDWDNPLLAPRERDLMFVVEGSTKEVALFFTGYGNTDIDPVALAYYRYEWVVQELGDYGERVFLSPEVGDETRKDAVRGMRQLFYPGDVVEAAYRSEIDLPSELKSDLGI